MFWFLFFPKRWVRRRFAFEGRKHCVLAVAAFPWAQSGEASASLAFSGSWGEAVEWDPQTLRACRVAAGDEMTETQPCSRGGAPPSSPVLCFCRREHLCAPGAHTSPRRKRAYCTRIEHIRQKKDNLKQSPLQNSHHYARALDQRTS